MILFMFFPLVSYQFREIINIKNTITHDTTLWPARPRCRSNSLPEKRQNLCCYTTGDMGYHLPPATLETSSQTPPASADRMSAVTNLWGFAEQNPKPKNDMDVIFGQRKG
jgi:hypothetical protein